MNLKQDIGLFGVFSIASGAMISSGIFILPGLVYAKVGPYLIISYFLAGLLALIGILSTIELATAMPKAGGDYYFINKTFGPMIGTISGLLGWLALSLKSAFAIFGISEIIYITAKIEPLISSFVLCLIFALINIIGVKESVKFQILLVSFLISIIVIYIAGGFFKINPSLFRALPDININSILKTIGFIFISFGGLLKVVSISEEVKNPKRNLPLGIILSIIVVTGLYTLLLIVTVGTLNPSKFSSSLTPIIDSAKTTMGTYGFIIMSIASLLAFITTANAALMSASRYPLALSRDNLLPKILSKISKKFKTPIISISFTSSVVYLSLLLPLEELVKIASTIILSSYVLTNFSVIILRESKLVNYKPSFKVPLYPWTQIFGILIFSFFIIDLGIEAIEVILGFLLLCILLYFFYGKKGNQGEYALLYLLKRIVDERLSKGDTLEAELRKVVTDRDDKEQKAQFNDLIKKAKIIHINDPVELKELFNIISENISKDLKLPKEKIIDTILSQYKKANFMMSYSSIIMQIKVKENKKMKLVIVKCKKEVEFKDKSIKTVFILVSGSEKRILQLRMLAILKNAIEKISFDHEWDELKDEKRIKNFLINF